MGSKTAIHYSGFYDFPLAFVIQHQGKMLLFYREFDDDIDEYPNEYQVFILPDMSHEEISRSWQSLPSISTRYLGKIPIAEVEFDSTRTKEVDTTSIDCFLDRSLEGHD